MKKLIAATSIIGISTLVSLIIGLLRSKIMAIFLAPDGVGMVAQAFSFFTAVSTLTSLGLGAGIIKYVSLYKEEKKILLIRQIVVVAFLLEMSVSILLIISVVLFARPLSLGIFGTAQYWRFLILVALAVPFTTLVYFTGSVFLALGEVKTFTLSRVWGYFTGLIPMFLLIYFYGIKGGFIQIFLVAIMGFIFCLYYFIKTLPRDFYLLKTKDELLGLLLVGKKIFRYGLVMLMSTAFSSLSLLTVRSLLIHRLGTIYNGYYQVLIAFSGYYIPFFTNALWSYFYPKASSLDDTVEWSKEFNHTVRFLTIGLTAVIVLILLVKQQLVTLIFSEKFINATFFMESQLIGDLFYLFSTTVACSILAKGKVKAYFFYALSSNLVFIILSILMLKPLGLFGITISYVIAQLTVAIFAYLYHYLNLNISLFRLSLEAILYSLVLMTLIILLPSNVTGYCLKISLLVTWVFISIKKAEWRTTLDLIVKKCNSLAYKTME